jgi:membrane fusion protein, multidrug efflux system
MSSQISPRAENAAASVPLPAPARSRRGLFLHSLWIALVLALIGWASWFFVEGRWYASTDDAYVNGNIVQITPQINGTVVSIGADDGDLVHAGDVLVKLDRADADIALAQASANLANTVRRVRGLFNNVTGAQAEVAARKTAVDKARSDYERRRDLAKSGAISAEELAHASDALVAAQSAMTTTEQQYQNSKVLVDDTEVSNHPDVQQAAAQLRAAYLDDVRTTLLAPVDGYVARRSVQVGQRVQPGVAMMAVVPLRQVWVDANFKETQLTHMRIGQLVEVTSDIYGNAVKYHARVQSLGVGTGSAFSLLPAQNATGNWIKIVQRVPVRLVFTDPKQLDENPLRIGLSLGVNVSLRDQSGSMLAQHTPTRPPFSTDIYTQELAEADEAIVQVIHANMARGSPKPGDTKTAGTSM